ncbi:MAG: hypothetical protein LBB53_01145, partial [Prevotellaceae bacterium]|nr:hypothetical protein [Prevotellaceae bacterium]
MKKLFLISCLLFLSYFAFSQSKIINKFSTETLAAFGDEMEFGCMGIEIGQQLNYSLLDRFGFYTSLGGYHSLFNVSQTERSNSSAFLWNLNIFGDIV